MKHLLNSCTVISLVTGIILTLGNGYEYVEAKLLTGMGSMVVTSTSSPMLHAAAPTLKPAISETLLPMYQQATAADQLVIGILLILLGFFLHALWMSRDEKAVHVTVKPSHRKTRQWFWMEMRM